MTVTGGVAVDGVPAASWMRPADVAGMAPAAFRDDHEPPASVLIQMSPGVAAVPAPTPGGSAPTALAYTPLSAHRLTPPTCPVYTMLHTLSASVAPVELGRS